MSVLASYAECFAMNARLYFNCKTARHDDNFNDVLYIDT